MAMYYNGKKVRNLYLGTKCITRLALGKEMTRLVEGDDFVRAEWLCGRNGAYIDTNLVPSQSDHIDCHYRYDGITKNPDGEEQDIFGVYTNLNDGTSYRCRAYINTNNFLSVQFNLVNSFPTTGKTITDGNITNLHLNGEKYYFDVNGEYFNFPSNSDTYIERKNIWLFKYNTGGSSNRYFHGDIAYFHITDPTSTINRVNMTPCRLLRPIPASLDANGIARNAEECGMFDAVSGKFYGNVGSGAFTVEPSLVEGVDYERHKWLVVPYTSNDANTLPIKSNNFNYKYKFYSFGNIGGVWTTGNKYTYYPKSGENSIWGVNERALMYVGNSYELNTEISINCDANGMTMDGELIPNYGSSPYFDNLKIYCYTSTGNYALSSVTIDGIERYIPVRLLRPLPSYLDANGKARHQFECGMLDLKTMKFYGNDAATGTFTVSDN